MAFERVTEAGEEDVIYRITDIAEGKVVIDGNHPLAGQALVFEVEIAAERPATAEERAHGHPHEG
jgi:FKBP-type peptidyl-prolyl cis-trans isomerase SlyD